MTDINKVIVIGNITKDLDNNSYGYTQSGVARANVSIAVNRSRKDASGQWVNDVSYFDITVWGKLAENLKPYLLKGKKIAVTGFLKQDRWQDQQGNNRSRVSIVAEEIELLTPREDSNNAPVQNYQTAPVQNSAPAQNYQARPVQTYQAAPNYQTAPANNAPVQNYQQGTFDDFPEDIPF